MPTSNVTENVTLVNDSSSAVEEFWKYVTEASLYSVAIRLDKFQPSSSVGIRRD